MPALWWHIFEVLLIAAIVFQGYWRYRRFKSALPPPSPADRGVRFGPFIQGPGEWWKLPAMVLTVAIAGFLVWQNAAVDHQDFKRTLPAVIAGALGLSAILGWLKPTKRD